MKTETDWFKGEIGEYLQVNPQLLFIIKHFPKRGIIWLFFGVIKSIHFLNDLSSMKIKLL